MTDCEPGRFAERRSDQRTATVYRPVLIETDEIAGFCLLRNISPEGMMGRFYTDFAANTPVTVQFNALLSARGTVSWSRDGKIGILFASPIDVQQVLQGLTASPRSGQSYRAPRLQIQATVQLVVDGRTVSVEVQDISQKGLKVRASFLRSADEVSIMMDGLAPKKAVVRWTQPNLAGLNFIQPLAFDQLGEWVVGQHERAALVSARSSLAAQESGQVR